MKKWASVVIALVLLMSAIVALPVSPSAVSAEKTQADWKYTVHEDGTVKIDDYNGTDANVTVPAEIDGHTVTTIGGYAFMACYDLVTLTIPDSVTMIGDFAFNFCTGLVAVDIPDSVTVMGEGVFNACYRLVSVTLPKGITEIGNNMFCGCRAFTSYIIPEGVTTIGSCAFEDCTDLAWVTIPDSVTTIGDSAFNMCPSLERVCFDGSQRAWDNVDIELYNEALTSSSIHFLKEDAATGAPTGVKGDLNGDGVVNIMDAVRLYYFVNGKVNTL